MKKINHITNKRIVIYVKKEFKTDDNDRKNAIKSEIILITRQM